MAKAQYEELKAEIICFERVDVITQSGTPTPKSPQTPINDII